MAQACKVIAYACGYQPSDGHGNYWYDEYIDYVRESRYLQILKPRMLLHGNMQKNYFHIAV